MDIPKYDTSTKPFEVQRKVYRFDKYTRKLRNSPVWLHHRYYKTLEGATDGIRDFRRSIYDIAYYDYPSMGDVNNEKLYPHLKPTINIPRYRIIERNLTN